MRPLSRQSATTVFAQPDVAAAGAGTTANVAALAAAAKSALGATTSSSFATAV